MLPCSVCVEIERGKDLKHNEQRAFFLRWSSFMHNLLKTVLVKRMMERHLNIRFTAIWVVLTLLLSGCSSVILFYDYGPSVVRWQVDGYFNLTGKQDDWLEERLNEQFAWNRRVELENYIDFLKQVQIRGADGLSLAELQEGNGILVRFQNRIVDRIIPDTAVFLSTIQEPQVEYLEKEMLEENEEFEMQLKKKPDIRTKDRLDSLLDTLEDWIGSLSDEQIEKITQLHSQWYDNPRDPMENWMDRRIQNQQTFLALLRRKPDAEQLETWLNSWQRSWSDPVDPLEKDRRERRIRRNMQRILEIDALLTKKQRQHAVSELQDWVESMQRALPYH